MPYDLPESLKKKRSELREFLAAEIAPIADERDSKGPLSHSETVELFKKLLPHGYNKSFIPVEAGGLGSRYLERAVMAEELGRVWAALAVTLDTHSGVIEMIARNGTDEHRRRWVEPALRGEILACDMVSEPQAGSDQTNLQLTAILDGDHYVVNGKKMWQTNGVLADVGILTAVTDKEAYAADPRKGVISLIVDSKESPWEVRDIPFVGLRSGNTGLMEFDQCTVPAANLLHGSDKGYSQNLVARSWFRVNIAAIGMGLMQAALDDAIAYAKRREAFRKPIAGFQLVQNMLADMVTDVEVTRLLVYRASSLMDQGERCDVEQCMAATYGADAAVRVTQSAMQIHGARGFTTDEGFKTERYWRDAALGYAGEGTTQILKLVIGRRLTGIQAFV
ncbi:MAG: acyl-CoA dehydrogenase family protein [Deltaproteobacteria bacterium]|nr:acyl-CoA dehydrogenase family protein [Deltaproteobacteria bacterium]